MGPIRYRTSLHFGTHARNLSAEDSSPLRLRAFAPPSRSSADVFRKRPPPGSCARPCRSTTPAGRSPRLRHSGFELGGRVLSRARRRSPVGLIGIPVWPSSGKRDSEPLEALYELIAMYGRHFRRRRREGRSSASPERLARGRTSTAIFWPPKPMKLTPRSGIRGR